MLAELELLSKLLLTELTRKTEIFFGPMHQFPMPPKCSFVKVFITDVTVPVLDPLMSRHMLLVAGLPGEPLVAECAVPRGAGSQVVPRHVDGQGFLGLEDLLASLALVARSQRHIGFTQQTVGLEQGFTVKFLPAEHTLVQLDVDHRMFRLLGSRVATQMLKKVVNMAEFEVTMVATKLLVI